jgi:hypothetical protein
LPRFVLSTIHLYYSIQAEKRWEDLAQNALQLPLGNSSVELPIADRAVLLEDKLEVAACIPWEVNPALGILAQRHFLTTLAEQEAIFVPLVATCAAAVA